jgi:hypothetical protein
MADSELRRSASEDVDAGVFVNLVLCRNDYGCYAVLASRARARWETGVGRCKASIRELVDPS